MFNKKCKTWSESVVTFVENYKSMQLTSKMFKACLKYFPFPHPISINMDPVGKDFINSETLGQALCLVSLKWDAISS